MKRIFKNHSHINEYGPLVFLSIMLGVIGGLGAIIFRLMINFNKNLFIIIILPRISFYVGDYNLGVIVLPALGGLIVGGGMNSRGAIELVIATFAYNNNLIPVEIYSALVVMAFITTIMFPIIMKVIISKDRSILKDEQALI